MKVKLYASFREGRLEEQEWNFYEGITVDNILEELNIDKQRVGVLFVNSRHVKRDHKLSEDDILAIFPIIAGG